MPNNNPASKTKSDVDERFVFTGCNNGRKPTRFARISQKVRNAVGFDKSFEHFAVFLFLCAANFVPRPFEKKNNSTKKRC